MLASVVRAGLILIFTACLAAAQVPPPAECRDKYLGTWAHPGGTTVIKQDGTAKPSIGRKQYWTCSGNRYQFSNSPGGVYEYSMVLSPDGQTMTGSFGSAVKVGGQVGEAPKTEEAEEIPQSDTCSVKPSAAESTLCSGTNERCECLRVTNGCPYPVSVRYRLSDGPDGSTSLKAAGARGDSDTICATRDAAQTVRLKTWRPQPGFPKKGQPRPG